MWKFGDVQEVKLYQQPLSILTQNEKLNIAIIKIVSKKKKIDLMPRKPKKTFLSKYQKNI